MRKRDFGFLAILAIAIYISLDNTSFNYRLEPAWYYDQRKHAANEWQQLSPIITDLNGDGRKEVLFVTRDQYLKVLNAESSSIITEDVYSPEELASVRLSPSLSVNKVYLAFNSFHKLNSNFSLLQGRNPILLRSGYIDQYNETSSRSQIVIVIREDLTVSCYDSTLELLWEKTISHKSHDLPAILEKFKIDEIAVTISPLSIKDGEQTSSDAGGIIVLGISMGVRNSPISRVKIEQGIDMGQNGDVEHPEMEIRSKLEHFNMYALDARNGDIIWKHDGLEVRAEQYTKSLPQHAYKLDVKELSRQTHHAPGINDWTMFRQSLIGELPHDWHDIGDTSLRLAHFVRRHFGAGAGNQIVRPNIKTVSATFDDKKNKKRGTGKVVSGEGRFLGVESPPLSLSATLPHDAAEHTEHPNVIVAHTKHGLEVIALRTGLPITSLALTQGQSYTDLDGDGIVDSLLVLENEADVSALGEIFAHDNGEIQHCTIMAVSGLPPRSQLFNGSLCLNQRNLQDPMSKKKIPQYVTAASPLILRTLDISTMRESKIRDVVVGINTGTVACYSGDGSYKWQFKGAPIFSLGSKSAAVMAFDSDSVRVDELGTHDNRHAQILVAGDSAISILSRDGAILCTAEVPKIPIAKPILGDFDNDFITDVIILTEDALLGYRLEVTASAKGLLIAFIVLAVLAVIVFISGLRSELVNDSNSGNIRRKLLASKRSTDEYHID